MAIEKINFSYPKSTLQTVYDTEATTALELASLTSAKVDECVELVNGVEQTATESRNIVDTMRTQQEQFVTENNDTRQALITENQAYIDSLEASKTQLETDMDTELTNYKASLNTSKTTFETDMTSSLNTFKGELTTAKTTFETDMTNSINTINANANASIQTDVNNKLDAMATDGTLSNLINNEILTDVRTDIQTLQTADTQTNNNVTALNNKIGSTVYMSDFPRLAGEVDDTGRLQRARDFIAALPKKKKLIFEAGVYTYTVSPNWAIQGAIIEANGEVILSYDGVGDAVIIDAEPLTADVYGMYFGDFIIEGHPNSKNGMTIQNIHHGEIHAKVRGCGANYSAYEVKFCVCTKFYISASANDNGGWRVVNIGGVDTPAKPKYGLTITKGLGGYATSYCQFYTPIFDYCDTGIYLDYSYGNTFYGGTAEGSNIGVNLTGNAWFNKFFGTDFEVNTNYDVFCQGFENSFYDCDSWTKVYINQTASNNLIIGGTYSEIEFHSPTKNNYVANVKYNRHNTNKTITDNSGNKNIIKDCINKGNSLKQLDRAPFMPDHVSPDVDNALIGDGAGFYTGVVMNAVGYPNTYGTIRGYKDTYFPWNWQEFIYNGETYKCYALSATQWSAWKKVTEV